MTTYDSFITEDINEQPLETTISVRYAGFWMRFWAYIIDIIVVSSVQGIFISAFLTKDIQEKIIFGLWPVSIVFATILYYVYFACMTKYFAATLGKMIFGLKVIRTDNDQITWLDILFREVVGRFVYNIAFGFKVLYFIIAFTKEKQGIHDMIGNTRVIHVHE